MRDEQGRVCLGWEEIDGRVFFDAADVLDLLRAAAEGAVMPVTRVYLESIGDQLRDCWMAATRDADG